MPLRLTPAAERLIGALQQLSDDASLEFAKTLKGVRKEAQSVITKANEQRIVSELIASEVEGCHEPGKALLEILEDQAIVASKGKNRSWTLEDYMAVFTHTILAEAPQHRRGYQVLSERGRICAGT